MELNYQELGFRCGLEVHQQLEGKKLFCNCLTLNSQKDADVKFQRKLKAVVGETGEIDIAAEHEMLKNRVILYEGNSEDVCLVECDDEPPHELNKKALETTIKIALLLNAKIVDEIQVMRKTVVDGSNVSGFQRTALVAMNGFIEIDNDIVKIPTICLEEEAAQKLDEGKDFVKYRLDRLGIPLIEIATSAEIKNPEHAKEVAGHIGMVLRSVESVKRGLGTIRQDVNISIKEGARTEIKGFQDLRSIPKVIEYEVKRQIGAVKEGKKISKEVRKAETDFTTSFLRPLPGAARLYPETDVLPVRLDKNYIGKLRKELPKLLKEKVEEYKNRFGLDENTLKQIMKLKYNVENLITPSMVTLLKRMQEDISLIKNLPKPSFFLRKELEDIKDITKDVEKVANLMSSFNIPFDDLRKTQERITSLRNSLVHGFSPLNLINQDISKVLDTPKILSRTLTNTYSEIKKDGVDIEKITENNLKDILLLVAEDKISKESIPDILKELDKGKTIEDIIEKYKIISEQDLENQIKQIIKEKPNLNASAYMGLVMAKYRGKVDGKRVMELVKKFAK